MTRPRTRTGLAVVPAVLAGLLLSACGAGLHAQVYEPRNQGDSVNVTADTLALRNIFVAAPPNNNFYAEGADAELKLTVVNRKDADDALVSASSSVAESVTIQGGQIEVAGFSSSPIDSTLVLTGLNRQLDVASYVAVNLTFQSGAQVTVNAPVSQAPGIAPSLDPDFHVPEVDSNGKVVTEGEGSAE